MPAPRRRRIGHRRRVEDEGDDDGRTDALDLDDDSLTEGSISDDDAGQDSDTSNIDEASPTSAPGIKHSNGAAAKAPLMRTSGNSRESGTNGNANKVSDTEMMLHGLSIADRNAPPQEMQFDEVALSPPKSPSAPVVVSSASAMRQQTGAHVERRRQEHEDYKRRRDEDPAFVPNRGSFFMHDHRHAGPAGNGFRPFGRGRGRGGRFSVGGPFAPFSHMNHPSDPTTNSQWTHDMHDTVAEPVPRRPRQMPDNEGPPNGTGFIPTCEPSETPINRTLSTEKHIGNAQVRVLLPEMKTASVFPGIAVKQYTKLPDHRPPLRRDKPVRISLPDNPPRYIFPAPDRSFTFIPRALRPNQQRMRGKPRSNWGSIGGFSRRTSVFGGSYYGSAYSPSIALSRRSSIVHERDFMFSPTASVISRPAMPADNVRPVVRLPPSAAPQSLPVPAPVSAMEPMSAPMPMPLPFPGPVTVPVLPATVPAPATQSEQAKAATESSINELPQPQTHPLPQKPAVQESRPNSIPIHQPRPQKNISVADIESPAMVQGGAPPAFQQAFHQQVPIQVANGYSHDSHSRRPSYQQSTGTPLSHIPERAIHAAPFQPNSYSQAPYYGQPMYQNQHQQGYYYSPGYSAPNMPPSGPAPGYVPSGQPSAVPNNFGPQSQPEQGPSAQGHGHNASTSSNLVAQEVNGMVYYYDASQIGPVNSYSPYSATQNYQPGVMGMGGIVTPSPDTFYYPQHASGMMYYPQ